MKKQSLIVKTRFEPTRFASDELVSVYSHLLPDKKYSNVKPKNHKDFSNLEKLPLKVGEK